MTEKCLVSLSGGLDSTTLLYLCKSKFKEVKAVSFNYGSRQNNIEQEFAKYHCKKLGIEHNIIDIRSIFKEINKVGNCSLLNNKDIPEGEYKNIDSSTLVVPFRNGIFLSILAGIAEASNCKKIALASHASDWSCYPDCRPQFTNSIKRAIFNGTSNNVKLYTPYVNSKNPFTKQKGFSKGDIVKLGFKIGMTSEDFKNTYSCYTGEEIHCGKCPTCLERKEAFKYAGKNDPTEYNF